jgi:hypothetical protein
MPFISAEDAATLVALNLHRRSQQDGKAVNRVRVSEKTLAEITGRRRLDGRFAEDFAEGLLDLGWVVVRTHSAWGFLRASAVAGWPRLNASRISGELEQIAAGDVRSAVANAQTELRSARESEVEIGTEPEVRMVGSEELAAD